VDSTANGLTLCSGSLGANQAKDVPAIAHRFGDRIHFAHLRPVSKDIGGSFEEAALLEGDTDMGSPIDALLMADGARADQGLMPIPSARTTATNCCRTRTGARIRGIL